MSRLFLASLGAQSKIHLILLQVLGLIFAIGSQELWKYCSYWNLHEGKPSDGASSSEFRTLSRRKEKQLAFESKSLLFYSNGENQDWIILEHWSILILLELRIWSPKVKSASEPKILLLLISYLHFLFILTPGMPWGGLNARASVLGLGAA